MLCSTNRTLEIPSAWRTKPRSFLAAFRVHLTPRLRILGCGLGGGWSRRAISILNLQFESPFAISVRSSSALSIARSKNSSSSSFNCNFLALSRNFFSFLFLLPFDLDSTSSFFCLSTLLSHFVSLLSPLTQLLPPLDSTSSSTTLSKLTVLSTSDGTEIVEGRSERRENSLLVGILKGEDFD